MSNKPSFPLHVELVSAPNIINDGTTENTFSIGVFNTQLTDDFVIKAGFPLYFFFVVSDQPVGQSPDRAWGLTSNDLLYDSAVHQTMSPGHWKMEQEPNHWSNRPDLKGWKATPDSDYSLPAGGHLTFTISGLKSALPDGYTTPQFYYEGDQSYSPLWVQYGPILKTPIVASQQSVGIGTDNPSVKLEIQSPNSTDIVLKTQGGTAAWARYHLVNDQTQWLIGTSADWYKNMLYIANGDQPIDEATHESPIKFSISPEGKTAIGNGALPNDYRLSLQSQSRNHLQIASDLNLSEGQDHINLIKFGSDAYSQIMFHGNGHFNRPTLGLHVDTPHALGFYSTNWTPLLEVEGGTGNTFIKGNLSIDGDLQIASNLNLVSNRQVKLNLIKFGTDGDFQMLYNTLGHYNLPTIALHAESDHAIGFYSTGLTPLLEVKGGTGDTYIRGNLDLGGAITGNGKQFFTQQTVYSKVTEETQATKNIDTGISCDDYILIITGYQIDNMDVNENSNTSWGMNVNASGFNTWNVTFQIASQENYEIWINTLAILKVMVQVNQ